MHFFQNELQYLPGRQEGQGTASIRSCYSQHLGGGPFVRVKILPNSTLFYPPKLCTINSFPPCLEHSLPPLPTFCLSLLECNFLWPPFITSHLSITLHPPPDSPHPLFLANITMWHILSDVSIFSFWTVSYRRAGNFAALLSIISPLLQTRPGRLSTYLLRGWMNEWAICLSMRRGNSLQSI